MGFPVVKSVSYVLAHTPSLVRYGSKPTREIAKDPKVLDRISSRLRSLEEAVTYPPHQVYIGNCHPAKLWEIEQPWYGHLLEGASRCGEFGEIVPEDSFYGMMKIVDEFELVVLSDKFVERIRGLLAVHSLIGEEDLKRLGHGLPLDEIEKEIQAGALPLYCSDELAGCMRIGHEEDSNLTAEILLENLACKASAVWSLRYAVKGFPAGPAAVDYVMGCGEEGVGDRYQRGGGNLGKAIAEQAWCTNSSGADIKAFCCSPVHALVLAAGLVQSGIFREVAVVGGGSLAKLGMKMRGHLAHEMPILEDVLGGLAVIVGQDDGYNPQIRLDSIGKHEVAAASSAQAIMESLVTRPLDRLGWSILDIDRFSTELHNPEITEPAGSGNVARNNYRMIAGLAVMRNQLDREYLGDFANVRGMPGYSPTQGHIAAAVPYLGHARQEILSGQLNRVMFVAKGSLFLAKMTTLSDGMSFVLQKNDGGVKS